MLQFIKRGVPCRITMLAMFSLIATGCSNQVLQEEFGATADANPDVLWQDGLRAIDTGEATLERGEKRVNTGREQILMGTQQLRDAGARADQAKLDYARVVGSIDDDSFDKGRNEELLAIGKAWANALDDLKAGNAMVMKGNTNIERGEEDIRQGRSLMETGSVLMRNSHRSRSGQALLPLPRD